MAGLLDPKSRGDVILVLQYALFSLARPWNLLIVHQVARSFFSKICFKKCQNVRCRPPQARSLASEHKMVRLDRNMPAPERLYNWKPFFSTNVNQVGIGRNLGALKGLRMALRLRLGLGLGLGLGFYRVVARGRTTVKIGPLCHSHAVKKARSTSNTRPATPNIWGQQSIQRKPHKTEP